MIDIRFQNFEDGELADIWYALTGASSRHPGHFHGLANALLEELVDRRGAGLNPWLEERYRSLPPGAAPQRLAPRIASSLE
jgi:hypothetical protein